MDHNFEVEVAIPTTVVRKKVEIPFRGSEKDDFERFLDARGLKAGPWLRVVALEAMKESSHV